MALDEDAAYTIATELTGTFPIAVGGETLFEVSARLDRLIVRPEEPDVLILRDYKTAKPNIDMLESFVAMLVAKLIHPEFKSIRMEIDWFDGDGRVTRETLVSSEYKGFAAILVGKVQEVLAILRSLLFKIRDALTARSIPSATQCRHLSLLT